MPRAEETEETSKLPSSSASSARATHRVASPWLLWMVAGILLLSRNAGAAAARATAARAFLGGECDRCQLYTNDV